MMLIPICSHTFVLSFLRKADHTYMKTRFFLILACLLFGFKAQGQLFPSPPDFVITWSPLTPCANSPVNFIATDTTGQYVAPMYWWYVNNTSGYANPFTVIFPAPGLYQGYFSAWDSLNWNLGDSLAFVVFVDSACGPSDLVSGHVYDDLNGNGTQDVGEPDRSYAMVELTPGPYYFSTDYNGDFSVNLPAGNWTLNVEEPLYWTSTQPAAGTYSLTLTGAGATFAGNDFGLAPIPNMNDLMVSMYAAPPVPGFQRWYNLYYTNVGTTTLSGNVEFNHDPALSFVSAAGGTHAGNTVTFPFSNLAPGATGHFEAVMMVPLGTTIGSTVTHTAVVNPVAGDQTPSNNIDTLVQTVVASYDPNDKSVAPEGNILPGTSLEYKVRFQNTGSWYATNVVVRDTLDADVDQATFQFLGSSHPCSWLLDQGVLTFTFNNINLDWESNNEPASHGHLSYSIQARSGLSDGTTIENTAGIYFDFNAPIITNTTVNTVDLSTGTVDPSTGVNAVLFPNPFTEEAVLNVGGNISGAWTVTFFDLSGKVIKRAGGIGAGQVTINREGMAPGIYLYTVTAENQTLLSGKAVVR